MSKIADWAKRYREQAKAAPPVDMARVQLAMAAIRQRLDELGCTPAERRQALTLLSAYELTTHALSSATPKDGAK